MGEERQGKGDGDVSFAGRYGMNLTERILYPCHAAHWEYVDIRVSPITIL